ncbi:uncharacterized protein K460DRAFT_356682 [Cucurbitaria berberidis CBS 394.84]|uniref:Uncharacterized protein n=1 Tax=Cucurbitaria berberidis CBS 394.84 TaxID=1168544 RepID=A0A9P4GBM9_9PLEO|nr:uncharacterized protein K460DRAFT_356682 [Cucurbitaria berberidis CBS 394.84]KAF1842878.1 hypothetical protein K460DRAFT_356682 [Cucurbitaria berberidis CBS 394.84]
MSERSLEVDSTLPQRYNLENFKPYAAPFNLYKVLYPRPRDLPGALLGYTVDKYWFDVCMRLGMAGDIEPVGSCTALMNRRMQVVSEATEKYGKRPWRKYDDQPSEMEVTFWWVTPKGEIDKTMAGDVTSVQNLDATMTLGLAVAIDKKIAEQVKMLVEEVGPIMNRAGVTEERARLLNNHLRQLGSDLTVEDIYNVQIKEREGEGVTSMQKPGDEIGRGSGS